MQEDQFQEVLAQAWGITDAESLRTTAETLLRGDMHTPLFDMYLSLTGASIAARAELSDEEFNAYQNDLGTFIQNMAVSNPTLGDPDEAVDCYYRWLRSFWDERFIPYGAGFPNTTRAWDITRAVHIAFFAVLAGHIKDSEFLDISRRALAELRKYFNDWSDVAASFWWGRAIWRSDDEGREGAQLEEYLSEFFAELHAKADILVIGLTAEDSPWLGVPLHA